MQNTSVFKTLSALSVKDKVEKRGNLDYLSWANAWAMLKMEYPDAQRKIYEHDHTGLNYFSDGKTAYVKVGIVVNGIEHIDYLPIMDNRHNAMPIDKVTSTDVNNAIQRSTAKAIAMHGLGLSLWTGEDIVANKTIEPKVVERKELTLDSPEWEKVKKYCVDNSKFGAMALIDQVSTKYILSDQVKLSIKKLMPKKNAGHNPTTEE
jgi:hypothetical protein